MQDLQVVSTGEYGAPISKYFQQSFPKAMPMTNGNLLDVLTTILIGTKDMRYGSIPTIEGQYTIRQTIAKAIAIGHPIPMLFPFGGRKLDPKTTLDIAEVSAIKQMVTLDENIKKFFPQGIQATVRIEDVNALWLYKNPEGIEEYSSDLVKLFNLLAPDNKIHPVRESQIINQWQYETAANGYLQPIIDAINGEPFAMNHLQSLGWKGDLPHEQVHYYMDRYAKMYPTASHQDRVEMLARYFAGSIARYDLNATMGPVSDVGSFIAGNFAHPVPGAPTSLFNKTLYYRTIPESYGRTHIAAWRAKGYMEVTGRTAIPKVAYPGTPLKLIPHTVRISLSGVPCRCESRLHGDRYCAAIRIDDLTTDFTRKRKALQQSGAFFV